MTQIVDNPMKAKILLCDDDETFSLGLRHLLQSRGFSVISARHGDEALAIVKNRKVDLILMDVQMRSANEGIEFIPKLKSVDADLCIVMLSGSSDFQHVRTALLAGAYDYLSKADAPEELLHRLKGVLDRKSITDRYQKQATEVLRSHRRHVLVGSSSATESLRRMIDKVRQSRANVLIFGETGTGKEIVARQLRSEISEGEYVPFVAIDSATIHSQTAESILFGHEKGAFTGAEKSRKGVFEEADGGIVYFDEIANMPLEIQAKLLRVIQEKEVTRLGSSRAISVDFRVVSATNRDLDKMVSAGEFKDDLLQRLNVLPLFLKPLRERKEDIPELVAHFIKLNKSFLEFTTDAMAILINYHWPGNVRELENVIAYHIALSDSNIVDVSDLPEKIKKNRQGRLDSIKSIEDNTGGFYERVQGFEKQLLLHEYEKSNGNMSQLASRLGMDRSHLYAKLKSFGIHQSKSSSRESSVE